MQNLDFNQPIVNPDGTPTEYFMRLLQNRGVGQETLEEQVDALIAKQIIAGDGLDGGGTLGDPGNITLTADVQEILDQLTTTHGAIIYRDSAAWGALGPGTSGQVLQTNGANADPSWVTPSSGGNTSLDKSSTASGTTASTAEQNLKTYTLPGGTLSADGVAIEIIASGTLAATTRTRTITVYFGTSGQITFSSAASTVVHWGVRVVIMRSGSSEQRWFSTAFMGIGGANENPVHRVRNFTTSIDNTANQTVKVTGTVGAGAVANDIVCNMWRVSLLT